MAAQFDFESASGDTAADRCRTLWASVLNQAISDACGDIRRPSVAKSEVDRARSFCLAEMGMKGQRFAPWLASIPMLSGRKC